MGHKEKEGKENGREGGGDTKKFTADRIEHRHERTTICHKQCFNSIMQLQLINVMLIP